MDEYYCPNCGAILNDQEGFNPDGGTWTCTQCGKFLMDDDIYDGENYPGVAWFCDKCGALLNRQTGFSDNCDFWTCTQCGYVNGITEDDIIKECPNCGARLNDQLYFSNYEDDWECTECGAMLHHDDIHEPYEEIVADEEADEKDDDECDEEDDDECDEEDDDEYDENDENQDEEECDENDENQDEEDAQFYESCDDEGNAVIYSWWKPNDASSEYIKEKTDWELRKCRLKAFLFNHKKIQMKYDSSDFEDENYKNVEKMLHNQAFSNIKCIPVKDVYVDSAYRVEQVKQVNISGNPHFAKGDNISYDAEIVIEYHMKRKITIPFGAKTLRKTDHTEVADQFRKLGFIEIYEFPMYDLLTGWIMKDGSVEKVTIDGIASFRKNSVFTFDKRIEITYHTFKKK